MKKTDREILWNKYNKKCAYCGKNIEYKEMQADHIIPIYRGRDKNKIPGGIKASNELDNMNPSCGRCNRRKGTLTIEKFRAEIQQQVSRLKRDSNQYRIALDYGLIEETCKPVVFYYERVQQL